MDGLGSEQSPGPSKSCKPPGGLPSGLPDGAPQRSPAPREALERVGTVWNVK